MRGRARRLRRGLSLSAVVIGAAILAASCAEPAAEEGGAAEGPEIRVLELDGIINPVSARYVVRAIERADDEGAAAVVIVLDTPGGLLSSTRDMIGTILNADIPVAVYVAPPGARAASAGTFITIAAHVAAMAPNTTIGAATPVSGEGAELPEDVRNKAINDAVAYIRSIATERGRNADWAEDAVRDAVSIGADEALELDVIDLIVTDTATLVEAMDGRTVELSGGRQATLETADARLVDVPMSPFEEFLLVLSDPNIAVILLGLGSIGIYFELSNPGSFLPGIAGAIFLILALFSLGTLPINFAGLALLVLGLALLGAEIWVASGGILGIGGAVAFTLGGLLLIDDTQAPFLEVSRPLIFGIAIGLGAFVLVALRGVMLTRRRPAYIGGSDAIGQTAIVRGPNFVYLNGELWHARPADDSDASVMEPGSRVQVVGRSGLHLLVRPEKSVKQGE